MKINWVKKQTQTDFHVCEFNNDYDASLFQYTDKVKEAKFYIKMFMDSGKQVMFCTVRRRNFIGQWLVVGYFILVDTIEGTTILRNVQWQFLPQPTPLNKELFESVLSPFTA